MGPLAPTPDPDNCCSCKNHPDNSRSNPECCSFPAETCADIRWQNPADPADGTAGACVWDPTPDETCAPTVAPNAPIPVRPATSAPALSPPVTLGPTASPVPRGPVPILAYFGPIFRVFFLGGFFGGGRVHRFDRVESRRGAARASTHAQVISFSCPSALDIIFGRCECRADLIFDVLPGFLRPQAVCNVSVNVQAIRDVQCNICAGVSEVDCLGYVGDARVREHCTRLSGPLSTVFIITAVHMSWMCVVCGHT